jgi:hypothetical protein
MFVIYDFFLMQWLGGKVVVEASEQIMSMVKGGSW